MVQKLKEDTFAPVGDNTFGIPETEEAKWSDKFKAARDTTWLTSLYAQSDFNQEYQDEAQFAFQEEEIKSLSLKYNKDFSEDILTSKSRGEADFKMKRADNMMESYQKMGNLGVGSVTALLAAGVTDPALIPLMFVPYGAGVAGKVGQVGRAMQYVKRGVIVGSAEGAAIGAAEYALKPDAKRSDVLFATAFGGGFGGAMGGVQARLMKDIDAENFRKSGEELTEKGKLEFTEHTVAAQQSRVLDSIEVDGDSTVKVPRGWFDDTHSKALADFDNPSVYAKMDDATFMYHMEKTWGMSVQFKTRATLQEELEGLFATKSLSQLEEIVEKATSKATRQRLVDDLDAPEGLSKRTAAIQLGKKSQRSRNNEKLDKDFEGYRFSKLYQGLRNLVIDKIKYKIKPAAKLRTGVHADSRYVRPTTGITDGKTDVYVAAIKEDGKTSWVTTDKYGNVKEKIFPDRADGDDASIGLNDVVRAVFKHSAKNAEEARLNEARADLEETFGDGKAPAAEQLAAEVGGSVLTDADVGRVQKNIFDLLGLRKLMSSIGATGNSNNPYTRKLAADLGGVSSAVKNQAGENQFIGQDVANIQAIINGVFETEFLNVVRGIDTKNNINAMEQLYHVARGASREGVPQDVIEGAKRLNKMLDDIRVMAEKAGVKGMDIPQKEWMPRMLMVEKVELLLQRTDTESVEEAFATLIQNARRERGLPDDVNLTKRAAKKYWAAISDKNYRSRLMGIHTRDWSVRVNEDRHGDVLRDLGMTEEEIDAFTVIFDTKKEGKSANVHARRRMLIDDITSLKLKYKAGHPREGEEFDFNFSDLTETNAERVMLTYMHRMSGAIALSRKGIDGDESFQMKLKEVEDYARANNLTEVETKAETSSLIYLYESIRGTHGFRENYQDSTRTFWRRVRELNFIRLMGASGLAAIIETSNVVAENGLRAGLKNVVSFRKLFKKAQDGKLENELVQELTSLTGLGMDLQTGFFRSRYDDLSDVNVFDQRYTKTDEKLAMGRKAISIAGGLAPVTIHLSRANMVAFTENMHRQLIKNNNAQIFSDVKMKQYNLTPETMAAIKREMQNHASVDAKGRLKTLNTAKWDDKDALDAFRYAAYLDTSQNVQKSKIASNLSWQKTEVAKTALQFWGYTFAATEQQYARQAARLTGGDFKPLGILSGNLFIASLAYMARVHINAEGRSDRDDYIEEKMEISNVARASVSYLGMLGMIAPIVSLPEADPTRLISSPAAQLIRDVPLTFKKLAEGALTDEKISEETWRKTFGLANNNPLWGIPTRYISNEIGD